jgi:hypothetical protein
MNGHSSDLAKKTLLPVSQHFVSPGHSLDDFGRSKIYIIDHKPSWKENQRQKRERFWKLQNRSNMDLLKQDVDDFSYFSVMLFSNKNCSWLLKLGNTEY